VEPAVIVIIGFMGPLILVSIIGIIYGLYTNKKNHAEHGKRAAGA
jgi:hypothetical protein